MRITTTATTGRLGTTPQNAKPPTFLYIPIYIFYLYIVSCLFFLPFSVFVYRFSGALFLYIYIYLINSII